MENLRRIITGHNNKGKSIISIDGPPSRILGEDVGGLFELWNTDGDAIDSLTNHDRADIDVKLSPPKNGTKFRYFAIKPTPKNIPKEKIEEATGLGEKMVLLCSPVVRPHFKKLTEKFIPNLIVISHNELGPDTKIKSLGTVRL